MFNDHHDIMRAVMHKLPASPHFYSLYNGPGAGRCLILPESEVEGLIQVCWLYLSFHVVFFFASFFVSFLHLFTVVLCIFNSYVYVCIHMLLCACDYCSVQFVMCWYAFNLFFIVVSLALTHSVHHARKHTNSVFWRSLILMQLDQKKFRIWS